MSKCKFCGKPFKRKVKRRLSVRTKGHPKGFPIEKIYCSYRCSRYDYYWRHHIPAWAVRAYRWLVWKYHWLRRVP